MRNRPWLVTLVTAAVAAGVVGWLVLANRALKRELAEARRSKPAVVAEVEATPSETGDDTSKTGGGGERARGGRDAASVMSALGQAFEAARRPDVAPVPDGGSETRESRRARRQKMIQALLGRGANESEEDYKKRVVPLVKMVMTPPRDRMSERRAEFEAAANLTAEQKAELDAALGDSYGELLGLANKSIAAGDLTPYRRNPKGILAFLGGTSGTVDQLDARMGKILSPEQLAIMQDTDFDLVEYLAVMAPWENANPPPAER